MDIVQDGQGFIWIATESGLNRFDGKSFSVYTKNNSGLISNELNTLLYDKEENVIWIGSQREGISIFDCHSHTFRNYTIDQGLNNNDVTDLSHASDGGIWITHYHVGVEYYDKKTKTFTLFADKDINDLKSPNWCSVDDGKGNLYIGHASDGISIVDIKNRTARNIRHNPADPKSLPGNNVRSIYIDSQKNIWVGTDRGLALFNPDTEEFITFRHDPLNPNSIGANHIYDIKEMKDGSLWISTYMSGISILKLNNIALTDPRKIVFQNIVVTPESNSLSSSNIKCLFQDSFNNIWIGYCNKGIDFISNKTSAFNIITYNTDKYKESDDKQIWNTYVDQDRKLWIGSKDEVGVFQNNSLIKIIDIKPYLLKDKSSVYINKIKSDKNGIIWLGTTNTDILRLNPKTYHIERLPFNEKRGYIQEFYEETNDKMWIGTDNGLYSYHNNTIDNEKLIIDHLEDRTIYSILRDKQEKLWIGTFGRGIYVFDKNNNLLNHLEKANGFCSNAINSLFLDSKGRMWIATRNGLAFCEDTNKPDRYETYDENQGLESSSVNSILEDNLGNIWVSTNIGISLLNIKEMKFNNYNHQDGTPMGNFISGSASLTKDGTAYFGSLDGVCYFNPTELTKEQEQVTPVQIIECLLFNKQIENDSKEILIPSADNKIELSYNQNSFRILFSNPDYSQNQQVEYAYMMEGLDDIWYNTQGENQVTFRNISPGNYILKIKNRLKNQDWDEINIATLNFIIRPPLWLTWYAKLFYIIVAGIIIYLISSSYKKRINLKTSLEFERKNSRNKQELNEERLRFYTNITHELRTPLTLIIGPLEDLIHDPKLPVPYNNKINIIHGSAIRLLNLINQILEFRKTETQNRKLSVCKANLADLVTEIGLRYKELNQNNNVTFEIIIGNKDTILYFDPEMITTIINNLLSNALKYTPSGEIRLSLNTIVEKNIHYTEFAVSDTGYGIEEEALPHIFDRYYQAEGKHQSSGTGIGLALVKSLAELHQGILNVDSTVGKGTTFTLRLLTENTYPYALHTEKKTNANIIEMDDEAIKEDNSDERPLVLIIEDDNDIQEYISTSLNKDYRILTARNGKEGLKIAQEYIPNIIVSDIMMPEMNGIEVCKRIKEDIRTSHIPVILLTAKDSIQDKEEGYESGADSYLTKPFSARLLQSRILNLLESRRKLAELINAQTKGGLPNYGTSEKSAINISKLDEEFLNRLTEIIENNIDMETLDIAFLKEKMHMSHSTLYRKIKGLTGITANEFIRKIRLKNSLRLLSSNSYNVSEAAYMSGFNDVVYFRRCFKEEYGVTPSEYKKKLI